MYRSQNSSLAYPLLQSEMQRFQNWGSVENPKVKLSVQCLPIRKRSMLAKASNWIHESMEMSPCLTNPKSNYQKILFPPKPIRQEMIIKNSIPPPWSRFLIPRRERLMAVTSIQFFSLTRDQTLGSNLVFRKMGGKAPNQLIQTYKEKGYLAIIIRTRRT